MKLRLRNFIISLLYIHVNIFLSQARNKIALLYPPPKKKIWRNRYFNKSVWRENGCLQYMIRYYDLTIHY